MSFVADFETKIFLDTLPNVIALWSPDEVDKAERWVRDRAGMVRTGVKRCPSWFMEDLMKIDSRLRCWWDAWNEEWVIDRFQDEGIVEGLLRMAETEGADAKQILRNEASGLLEKGQYYLTILHFKPQGEFQLNSKLLDALREMDMQRYSSPAEFIAEKRRKAAEIQKSNENSSNDKVLGAVDSLSDKQVHEFLEVSRALGTGETIVCHGEAEKFMDSIEEARKQGPPMPINKPDIFKPKRKGHK